MSDKEGQILSSLEKIAARSGKGVSVQNVRTALKKLERHNILRNESTNLNRIITICDDIDSLLTFENNNNKVNNKEQSFEKELLSFDIPNAEDEVRAEDAAEPLKETKTAVAKKASLITKAREIFEARFAAVTNEAYYWQGKDANHMKILLNAIKFGRKEKGLPIDEESIISAFNVFMDIALKDDWIKNHLSVAIISSKFNEIVAKAKTKAKGMRSTQNIEYGID